MSLKNHKETETNKVELELIITKQAFEDAINKVFKKNSKSIQIPGFRKGKATRGLVEKFYGKQVFYEDAINELLPSEIDNAVKETPYKIAGETDVSDVDFEGEEGITAKVTFTRYPDVKINKYKGLEVEKVTVSVDQKDIDAEIEKTRARYARNIEVTDRSAADGDNCEIDYEGFCGGEVFEGGSGKNHKLKLGSGSFIPGFEQQVVGKNIGEEFDVNVTFPEDYHAKELSGKEAVFKCKLNSILAEELPEIDDEFAKDASEFDTLSEYKADIKAKIEKKNADSADNRLSDSIAKALISNVEADIPSVLIEKEKENLLREYDYQLRSQGLSLDILMQYTGMKLDDIKERYGKNAVSNVKRLIALNEIAKLEKIEVTEEDIEKRYDELAGQFGMQVDELKKKILPEELTNEITTIKAFDFVKQNASITEKTVTAEQFEEMNAAANEEDDAASDDTENSDVSENENENENEKAKEENTEVKSKSKPIAKKKAADVTEQKTTDTSDTAEKAE